MHHKNIFVLFKIKNEQETESFSVQNLELFYFDQS